MSGIYVHVPFCRRKCLYCAFYSVALLSKKSDYLHALQLDIENNKSYLSDNKIDTIYFGGGTPSLLSAEDIKFIYKLIADNFNFSSDYEWTIEANPEQLTDVYLADLFRLGVNRLSIGVQSFDDDTLHFLGRKHSSEQAFSAVENAVKAGFENVSIDLIYGITQRGKGHWKNDLQKAMALPISHLSAYALTNEENSLLWRKIRKGELPELDDELVRDEFFELLEISRGGGFEQYEISNFARDGKISRHNFNYWQQIPYLGVGPSAHSFNGESRKWNVAQLDTYISALEKGEDPSESESLTIENQYDEYVLLQLRTRNGLKFSQIESQFGKSYSQYALRQIEKLNPAHYLHSDDWLVLTDEGKLFADGIAETLFL